MRAPGQCQITATARSDNRRKRTRLTLANQHLAAAERAQPLVALGDDLSAAKLSLQILEQRPTDSPAQSIYNFSVARAVENVERAKIQPWQHKIDIVGNQQSFTLTTPKPISFSATWMKQPTVKEKIVALGFRTHGRPPSARVPSTA